MASRAAWRKARDDDLETTSSATNSPRTYNSPRDIMAWSMSAMLLSNTGYFRRSRGVLCGWALLEAAGDHARHYGVSRRIVMRVAEDEVAQIPAARLHGGTCILDCEERWEQIDKTLALSRAPVAPDAGLA